MKSKRMSRIFRIAALITIVLLSCAVESELSADDKKFDRHDSETQNSGPPILNFPVEKVPEGSDSTCTAWTDGCRACGRNSDGIFCSNGGLRAGRPRCVAFDVSEAKTTIFKYMLFAAVSSILDERSDMPLIRGILKGHETSRPSYRRPALPQEGLHCPTSIK
jgi:hypothetical protein